MNDHRIHQVPKHSNNNVDFDQIISDLKKIFSGGGGNNGGYVGGAIALLLLVTAVYTSIYKVKYDEQAVLLRLGKYIGTKNSGLHFKLPFGIDQIYKVQVTRTLQLEFGFRSTGQSGNRTTYSKKDVSHESLMLTGDLNVADVEWAVQYKINDAWKYLFHAKDVERNIRDVSMSIMRRVVGDRLASEVLTTGRVEIATEAKVLTQQILDQYDMGIHIEQVILQDVNPPDPVKPAFNLVNAAKQEQEQAINNAEREYNRVIPEARGKAEKLISDANAYSIDIINRAKGDASQFNSVLKEYKKAPKITRQRLYIDTMEEIFSNVDHFVIVDKNIKGLLPLYSNTQIKPSTAVVGPHQEGE